MEVLTIYPAPTVREPPRGMKRLRKGIDYDLVNISLIGFDPVTGRSYKECQDEWDAEMAKLKERIANVRWWQLREQIAIRWRLLIMLERQGMPF